MQKQVCIRKVQSLQCLTKHDLVNFFLDSANKMKELLSTGINIYFSANHGVITSEKLEDFGGFITMLAKAGSAKKNQNQEQIGHYQFTLEE